MLMVLNLIQNNQMLGKQNICTIQNEQHISQMVGLYRLLVNARDFDTFKRLVVHARQNINTEMFVNCLVLALGERRDTQMLIVPALHEILPQLFHKDYVIDQVRQLDTGVSSIRPQLMDVMGMGRRNILFNNRIANQQGGLMGVLNRSQLWMPWRELHQQMGLRRTIGGNIVQQDDKQVDKVVVNLSGNGLLTQDIGLKSYVNILIDELIVNQDTVRNTNINQIGLEGLGHVDIDDVVTGLGGRRLGMDFNEVVGNRGFNTGRKQGYNTDTVFNTGRTHGLDIDIDNAMDRNRVLMGGRRVSYNGNDDLFTGRRLQNGLNIQNVRDMDDNMQLGRRNMQEGQNGINTVSLNDARLLFVGRRRKNPNTVFNENQNRFYDDDMISGGRRVSNDKFKHQSNKYYNNDDNEDLLWQMNQDRTINNHNRQIIDDLNHNSWGQGQGLNTIRGRDDFLNIVTRGRVGGQKQAWNDDSARFGGQGQTWDNERNRMNQRQLLDDDQDFMWNQGFTGQRNKDSLDMHLPTTSINDERLLHINRRKLNNVNEGRVNHRQVVFDDDEDLYSLGNQRGNLQGNWQRDSWNLNNQDERIGGRSNMFDNNRRGGFDNDQNDNQQGHNHGRRNRRSIINQNTNQQNTINGKLVLHTLQQLVARLNVERISLGQPQLIDQTFNNIVNKLQTNNNFGQNIELHGVDVQTVNKIENILQHIDHVLQQKIGQISVLSYNQKVNEIGLMLAGEIQELGLIDILGEILQTPQRKGQVANIIENQAVQVLLAGIVKVVDHKVQQVFGQRQEFISTVHGVNINNVDVDKMQTYLEQTDVDLSNLLINNDIQQTTQVNQKVVIGRMPRLNHKSFKIEVDVTSDRQQQVVVRNLLVPKVDGNNNVIPLKERRQNVIVLDIATVQLKQGRNNIKLHSNDITLTGRDTTPFTKIYQLVLQALNGNIVLQQQQLAGQTTLLPHHLLLPRGRINGLPMQLITVITPVEGSTGFVGLQTGTGIETGLKTLLQDGLPLNYPLHCDITDLDKVNSMPNLMIKDVKIYHDDSIQYNNMY